MEMRHILPRLNCTINKTKCFWVDEMDGLYMTRPQEQYCLTCGRTRMDPRRKHAQPKTK